MFQPVSAWGPNLSSGKGGCVPARDAVDINHPLGLGAHRLPVTRGVRMESNQRYYSRRAFEERVAAKRAMTETARDWHSKLAEDFAQRAATSTVTSALA